MTPTIADPTTNAVRAAPGSSLPFGAVVDFNFEGGWMLVEIFPVVSNLKTACGRFNFQRMCQTNITKLEMMPIGFAVSRDVHQPSVTGHLRKSIHQFTAGAQQILKSNRPRGWPVVEKHRDRSTGAVAMRISICDAGIDGLLI